MPTTGGALETPLKVAVAVVVAGALHAVCAIAPAGALEVDVAGRPLELSGHVEVRQVVKTNGGTPDEHNFQQLWLHLRYPLTSAISFASTLAGQNGGPTTKSTGAGLYTFDDVFQSRSPSLEFEEAFADLHLDDFDFRVGKQKFAWGKLDRFQPIDLLNTERYADPFLLEEDERKIGVPAVQGSYYLPPRDWSPEEGRLTLVWIPQYIPFRFPRLDERWFPPAAVPPDTFAVPAGIVTLPDGKPNPAFDVPLKARARNGSAPSFRMENAGYGARFSALAGGVDYALYYYHGFDAQPAFELTAEAFADPAPGTPLGLDISAETEVRPIFRRVDAWGADAAFAWKDLTLRAEAAYIRGRAFNRDLRFLVSDPSQLAPQIRAAIAQFLQGVPQVPIDLGESFVERDAIDWGVGVDYQMAGYLLLLQVNQTDVLDNGVDLLIKDIETRLIANLRKTFFHDDLTLQLLGLHAIESDYTSLVPRITYQLWEGLELRVGYLFLAGRRSSTVGQYKRNDEAFFRLRYLF